MPDKALKSTYWSLTELRGEDVVQFKHQLDIHLLFHINNSSLQGSDGCNRFKGNYVRKENSFHFGPFASTLMFCEKRMEQSAEFLQVLHQTDNIKIIENQLILFHDDLEIARFEAKDDY